MLLLYVDESGNFERPHDDHFVLGGLAVHESEIDPLRRVVESVIRRHLAPHLQRLEIHAHDMRTGVRAWRGIPLDVRHRLVNELSGLLGKLSAPGFALFAVTRAPGAIASADPLQRGFEELLLRFNSYLGRLERPSTTEFGLVVADKAKYEGILQPIVNHWRSTGTRFGRLRRLTEVPLFVDSSATRMIQLADLVAYAVYRHYAARDSELFERMLPAFDRDQGVIHGLVHLVQNYRHCTCPACVSRVIATASGSSRGG